MSLLARLGLAAVWLISGWIKFIDPTQTVVAVRAYQLLPEDLVRPVAYTMPMLEIALGLFLVIGLGVRLTAIVSAAALLVLIGVIISVWARGLSIDCGCFGGGGAADVDGWDYAREIARTSGSWRWRCGSSSSRVVRSLSGRARAGRSQCPLRQRWQSRSRVVPARGPAAGTPVKFRTDLTTMTKDAK